jgi:hypothetical protein
VLEFDGEPITYGDLALTAMISGGWSDFVFRCRTRAGTPVDDAGHDAAEWVEGFRRRHHLEAADDLDTWLERRRVSREDFERFARWQGREEPRPNPVPAGAGPEAWWSEAVLGGDAARWVRTILHWRIARELVGAVSVSASAPDICTLAADLGPPGLLAQLDERRVQDLVSWEAAHRAWVAGLAGSPLVDQRIRQNRLRWTRLVFGECSFATRSAASEFVLCVNEDASDLQELILRSGCSLVRHDVRRFELTNLTAAVLSSLAVGRASRPVVSGKRYSVYQLWSRVPPSTRDPQVRALARLAEEDDQIAVASAGRIVELGCW